MDHVQRWTTRQVGGLQEVVGPERVGVTVWGETHVFCTCVRLF